MLEVLGLTWGLADAAAPGASGPSGPSFSLSYRPAAGCPTRESFEAAILARAPAGRPAVDAAQADLLVDASFTDGVGRKGQLHVASRDGTSQDREIDADDCAEAVQSMAVIVGMILDAQPRPPAIVPSQAEPSPIEPEKPELAPAPVAPRATPSMNVAPARPVEARSLWLGAGVAGGIEGAAAPGAMPVAMIFGELGSTRRAALTPSLRLELVAGQAPDVVTSAGDARFRLALGRVYGCGLRVSRARADLRFCTVLEGGWLFARGMGRALNQRSQQMPWLGAGLGGVGGLRLTARWHLDVQAAARALAVHDEFIFAPDVRVHQVPIITWSFSLGVAYRDW